MSKLRLLFALLFLKFLKPALFSFPTNIAELSNSWGNRLVLIGDRHCYETELAPSIHQGLEDLQTFLSSEVNSGSRLVWEYSYKDLTSKQNSFIIQYVKSLHQNPAANQGLGRYLVAGDEWRRKDKFIERAVISTFDASFIKNNSANESDKLIGSLRSLSKQLRNELADLSLSLPKHTFKIKSKLIQELIVKIEGEIKHLGRNKSPTKFLAYELVEYELLIKSIDSKSSVIYAGAAHIPRMKAKLLELGYKGLESKASAGIKKKHFGYCKRSRDPILT